MSVVQSELQRVRVVAVGHDHARLRSGLDAHLQFEGRSVAEADTFQPQVRVRGDLEDGPAPPDQRLAAADPPHVDAPDRADDAGRADASGVRCRVVGELRLQEHRGVVLVALDAGDARTAEPHPALVLCEELHLSRRRRRDLGPDALDRVVVVMVPVVPWQSVGPAPVDLRDRDHRLELLLDRDGPPRVAGVRQLDAPVHLASAKPQPDIAGHGQARRRVLPLDTPRLPPQPLRGEGLAVDAEDPGVIPAAVRREGQPRKRSEVVVDVRLPPLVAQRRQMLELGPVHPAAAEVGERGYGFGHLEAPDMRPWMNSRCVTR